MNKEQTISVLLSTRNLSAYTIKNLSADTIKNLSADTIKNLSADTINNLSADTIKNLSADTIKNLELIEQISKIEKPYTRLLNGINENQLNYKQNDWGSIEEYKPESENVCNTAMCIAGHLVQFAGANGYKLKNAFSYAVAAEIIHSKTHPDVPVFNYFNPSNQDGLAYIELISEYENQTQPWNEFINDKLK